MRCDCVTVARVRAYFPRAVAEHAIAMMLSLNRKIHRAHARVREGNFALDGLLGFDMHGRTVGLVGTGKIGSVVALHAIGAVTLENVSAFEQGRHTGNELRYRPIRAGLGNRA